MLKPLSDKIIVEQKEVEATTKSGIVLTNTQVKPNEGTVVAVGPGRRDEHGGYIQVNLEVGDVVVYTAYAGTKVKLDDKEYLILSESDILAKY